MKKIDQLFSTLENVSAKIEVLAQQQRMTQKSSADAILEIATRLIAARFNEGVPISKWYEADSERAIEIARHLYYATRNK